MDGDRSSSGDLHYALSLGGTPMLSMSPQLQLRQLALPRTASPGLSLDMRPDSTTGAPQQQQRREQQQQSPAFGISQAFSLGLISAGLPQQPHGLQPPALASMWQPAPWWQQQQQQRPQQQQQQQQQQQYGLEFLAGQQAQAQMQSSARFQQRHQQQGLSLTPPNAEQQASLPVWNRQQEHRQQSRSQLAPLQQQLRAQPSPLQHQQPQQRQASELSPQPQQLRWGAGPHLQPLSLTPTAQLGASMQERQPSPAHQRAGRYALQLQPPQQDMQISSQHQQTVPPNLAWQAPSAHSSADLSLPKTATTPAQILPSPVALSLALQLQQQPQPMLPPQPALQPQDGALPALPQRSPLWQQGISPVAAPQPASPPESPLQQLQTYPEAQATHDQVYSNGGFVFSGFQCSYANLKLVRTLLLNLGFCTACAVVLKATACPMSGTGSGRRLITRHGKAVLRIC